MQENVLLLWKSEETHSYYCVFWGQIWRWTMEGSNLTHKPHFLVLAQTQSPKAKSVHRSNADSALSAQKQFASLAQKSAPFESLFVFFPCISVHISAKFNLDWCAPSLTTVTKVKWTRFWTFSLRENIGWLTLTPWNASDGDQRVSPWCWARDHPDWPDHCLVRQVRQDCHTSFTPLSCRIAPS